MVPKANVTTSVCRRVIFSQCLLYTPRFNISAGHYVSLFNTIGRRFIVAEGFNAKHTYWGFANFAEKGSIFSQHLTNVFQPNPQLTPLIHQTARQPICFEFSEPRTIILILKRLLIWTLLRTKWSKSCQDLQSFSWRTYIMLSNALVTSRNVGNCQK